MPCRYVSTSYYDRSQVRYIATISYGVAVIATYTHAATCVHEMSANLWDIQKLSHGVLILGKFGS